MAGLLFAFHPAGRGFGSFPPDVAVHADHGGLGLGFLAGENVVGQREIANVITMSAGVARKTQGRAALCQGPSLMVTACSV